MSNPQAATKKPLGFYVLCLAALAALAAGIYFIVIHGTFGLDSTHNGVCWDPLVPGLLIGGALIAAGLTVLNRTGLASAVALAAPGVALCVFVHKCYWYVVDVFMGIDEKHGFDPKFITFAILLAAAIVLAEAALYMKKTRKR